MAKTPVLSVLPAKMNIKVQIGATLDRTITWYEDEEKTQPVNLAAHTARMQVRNQDTDELIHDLTTENGGLFLGGINGTIRMVIDAADTETQDAEPMYVYGIELYDQSNNVIPFLAGLFQYLEDQIDPVA